MELQGADLDRGLFKFTLPYTWRGWLGWCVVLVVMVGAPFVSPEGVFISLLMLLVLATLSPTSLEAELYRIRKKAPQPEDLEAQALVSGSNITDWFYGQSSYVPTNDPSDWVLPAPGPSSWFMARPYHADPSNKLLPEHPIRIGTPTPAMISSYGLFMLCFLIGVSILAMLGISAAKESATTSDDRLLLLPYITMGIGSVWFVLGYLKQRQQSVMIDTSTSVIRSVAAGSTELVGQVRPTYSGAFDVLVDGHPNRMVPGCVSYHWTYEVLIRESKVTYRNGRRKVQSTQRWHTVRGEHNDKPFIIHDGTGGMYTRPSTFARKDWGGYIKRWESTHRDIVRDLYLGSTLGRLYRRGDVLRHRWTIHALRIGNPVYVLGTVSTRPAEELEWPGVSDVYEREIPVVPNSDSNSFWDSEKKSEVDYKLPVKNARLHMLGDDATAMPAMIKRGTELSNLARLRSKTELVLIPILTAFSGVCMLLFL
ncbi:MAG: hypothetical protein OSA38_02750 [Candidatus Poseidoniaceae archaeon]|nr:hypothetical protein [Candidatus Poseidoniaceae archaeon]